MVAADPTSLTRGMSTRTATTARRRVTLAAAAGAATLVALTGCGVVTPSGPTVTEDRDVPAGVTAVRLEGTGDLVLHTGDEPSLSVTARENVLDELTVREEDGVLVLGVRDRVGLFRNLGAIDWELTLPEVDGVAIEGTGDVDGDLVPVDRLEIRVDGTGDVRLGDVDVERLVVAVDGTGSITLSGSATEQDVRIDGTGAYEGENLTSVRAEVRINGTGDAHVEVTDDLLAEVDGAGTVTHGGTAHVSSHVDGVGSVRER